jgi:hypothetical protein
MPWTASDAKRFKKGLTSSQAKKWAEIANGALRSCQARGGSDCEGSAIRIANSKFDWQDGDWDWLNIIEHDNHFGISFEEREAIYQFQTATDRKKPGGSNAGKYKTKGPFCGPSGGAPKGTYPVNTRARAIAAISYSRHAPNPSGIKACVCRHWPGLPACKSKTKGSEDGLMEEKLPKGALRFVDEGCHAHVEFAETGEGEIKTKKLRMVGYSGGIIKGHWYWNNLAIDLEGIQFKQARYPVLEDHMTSRKIAVIGKPLIQEGKLMAPENAKFLSTEASEEFQKLSNEGFPYQSSIYAKPSNVERLEEGATAEVNGFTMKGPGTIWRQCEFKEMSVCVFGWDSKTQASAFSKEETEDVIYKEVSILAEDCGCDASGEANPKLLKREEVKKIMNKAELQEKYPDLVAEIVDEATQQATQAAEAKFAKDKDQLEGQVTVLKDDNTKLTERVLDLEKKDIIRAENELKVHADGIWTAKLAESDIPDSLHGKVKQYVSHSKFVSEGKFDEEAFATAVDAEIKDWEDKGVKSSVIGSGFSEKDVNDLENNESTGSNKEQVEADVSRLVKLAGGKVAKKEMT